MKVAIVQCSSGEHWVRAHTQSPYVRSDGTKVSGSYREAHYQKNPPSYATWSEQLKSGMPTRWEIRTEKPKA